MEEDGSGGGFRGGLSMARRHADFISRWKRLFLDLVIFIIFTASLVEYLWFKLSPMILKIIGAFS
jgi:hypothetical protein